MRYAKALVTGASSGLGVEFARQLAAIGTDVVISARREDRLASLAREIEGRGTSVEVIAADLATREGRSRLCERLAKGDIDLVINNAGLGKIGPFASMTSADVASQLEVNVVALTELSHAAVAAFRGKNRGGLLNIASVYAYTAVPYFAVYAATKAFAHNLTVALRHELAETGIVVASACPGITATEFSAVAAVQRESEMAISAMAADLCVRLVLREFLAGRDVIVPGAQNRLLTLAAACAPRRLAAGILGRLVRKHV